MSLTPRLSFLLPDRVRVRVVLLAVFGAVLLGTIVFRVLEGWSILDSLYVTVQTVTTVGFGDLTPRTPYGRAFAVVFMMVSVGIVLYALTSIVQTIVHSELFASEIIFNPSGSAQIEGGDMLIAIGNPESLARLNALARGRATTAEVKS